jgi:hypothetical protein
MSTETTKSATLKKVAAPTAGEKLSAQIKKVHQMHELVTKRAKFQEVLDRLKNIDYTEQKEFFSTDYSSDIKWQLLDGRTIIFSVSAPEVLIDVHEFFMQRIIAKMKELDVKLLG